MQEFFYRGRNQNGTAVEGRRSGKSPENIAEILQKEGIIPIHIEAYRTKFFSPTHLLYLFRKPIKLEEMMLFCRQMYSLNKAGIPLINAINRLAESTKNTTFKKILETISERINAGETLGTALQRYAHIFPELFIQIIQVGENSGKLDEAFLQLGNYLTLEEKTNRRIKAATRYPLFVLIAIFVAVMVINIFVIPAFAKLFEQFHAQLPLMTRILIGFSNFIRQDWLLLLISCGSMMLAFLYYLKTKKGKKQWHSLQRYFPLFGPIITKIHMIRFARTFSMAFEAGIPIINCLYLTASAIGNEAVKEKITEMQELIEHGSSMTQSALACKFFPPIALQMITVGEETGYLSHMLNEMADYYERESDYQISRLADTIEPVLIVIIGIMVLILALGVFLPMWDISRLMRGY